MTLFGVDDVLRVARSLDPDMKNARAGKGGCEYAWTDENGDVIPRCIAGHVVAALAPEGLPLLEGDQAAGIVFDLVRAWKYHDDVDAVENECDEEGTSIDFDLQVGGKVFAETFDEGALQVLQAMQSVADVFKPYAEAVQAGEATAARLTNQGGN